MQLVHWLQQLLCCCRLCVVVVVGAAAAVDAFALTAHAATVPLAVALAAAAVVAVKRGLTSSVIALQSVLLQLATS